MSLIKLFNGKYLKQNLKKSKGLLTILMLIVPVVSTLLFILKNSRGFADAIEPMELSIINILGMYILPFIISVILSGYIYKKNSVDFINSMPMSRKTIYVTNFIGGALIILFIQVLTLITNLICCSVLSNLFIPVPLILDCFVVMLISYIFMYSVCMLAQTVSGNELTQIVVVALILFLVPFTHYVFTSQDLIGNRIWEISYDGGTTYIDEYAQNNYTMPFNMGIEMIFYNAPFYNEVSMIKMIILTIIYLILGTFMFEKRKMENVGTSFSSLKVHYIAKALTLIPIIFICSATEIDNMGWVVAIGIMAIYYCLYDFVVGKKVKLMYTVIGFLISVSVVFGTYKAGMYIANNLSTHKITVNDIAEVSVNENFMNGFITKHNKTLDVGISDTEIIKEVISNSFGRDWHFISRYFSTEEFPNEGLEKYVSLMTKIKLKNGKAIYANTFIDRECAEKLLTAMKEKEEYLESFKFKDVAIFWNKFLTEEDTKTVKEIIEKKYYNTNEGKYYVGSEFLSLYGYDNHEARRFTVDIGQSKEIFEIAARMYNKETIDKLHEYTIEENDRNCHINKYTIDTTENGEYLRRDGISVGINNKLKEYFKNHCDDVCDLNKDFYIIKIYGVYNITFITNINPEIDEIINESGALWESQMAEYYEKEAELEYDRQI